MSKMIRYTLWNIVSIQRNKRSMTNMSGIQKHEKRYESAKCSYSLVVGVLILVSMTCLRQSIIMTFYGKYQ